MHRLEACSNPPGASITALPSMDFPSEPQFRFSFYFSCSRAICRASRKSCSEWHPAYFYHRMRHRTPTANWVYSKCRIRPSNFQWAGTHWSSVTWSSTGGPPCWSSGPGDLTDSSSSWLWWGDSRQDLLPENATGLTQSSSQLSKPFHASISAAFYWSWTQCSRRTDRLQFCCLVCWWGCGG